MPELGKGKYINGKMYCWDFDKKQFVQVRLKYLENSQVPPDVIAAFMNDTRGKEEGL